MQTRTSVDWLSITYKWESFKIQYAQNLNDAVSKHVVEHLYMPYEGQWQTTAPLQGYAKAIVNKSGVRVNFSRPGSPNGVHVVYSGRTLQTYDWESLLVDAFILDGQVTRIDIALDVMDSPIDILELYRHMKEGRCITQSKKYSYIEGNTGQTLYVGSRQSERMLRVYDKAAEQGSTGQWVRFELEVKGAKARQIAHYVSIEGSGAIPALIADFATFVDYQWPDGNPFEAEAINLPSIKGKETDTAKWLETGVLPSFKRVAPDNARVAALFVLDGLASLIEKDLVDRAFASVVQSGIVKLLNDGEVDICERD